MAAKRRFPAVDFAARRRLEAAKRRISHSSSAGEKHACVRAFSAAC